MVPIPTVPGAAALPPATELTLLCHDEKDASAAVRNALEKRLDRIAWSYRMRVNCHFYGWLNASSKFLGAVIESRQTSDQCRLETCSPSRWAEHLPLIFRGLARSLQNQPPQRIVVAVMAEDHWLHPVVKRLLTIPAQPPDRLPTSLVARQSAGR